MGSYRLKPQSHKTAFTLQVRVIINYRQTGELPWWLSGKGSTCSAGDAGNMGSILGLGRSPEEGMTTHSNILAWRIPWTEEPSGLQSMGSQRVGHD